MEVLCLPTAKTVTNFVGRDSALAKLGGLFASNSAVAVKRSEAFSCLTLNGLDLEGGAVGAVGLAIKTAAFSNVRGRPGVSPLAGKVQCTAV